MSVNHIDATDDEIRARLRKMDDGKLREYGRAALYMCSKKANPPGSPPPEPFVQQLRIAREVWRERHPKTGGKRDKND